MRKLFTLFPTCLIIHDGGAAAPAGDGGAAAAPGQTSGGNSNPDAAGRGKPGEAKPVVLYGKQDKAPDAGGQKQTEETETPEQRKASYEEFKSKYKDEFANDTQTIINRRFKETKGLQERIDTLSPLVDTLAEKYGIKDGDVKKLVEAVDNDNQLWEEMAEEAGLTVDQFKNQRIITRQNAALKEQIRQQDAIQQANQRKAAWIEQGKALKAIYPNFSLETEIMDPKFANLLKAGTDVQTAYQAIHFNDIVSGVATTAGKRAEQAAINNIQTKAKRPTEAGASQQSGVIVKDDPSKMSFKDLQEAGRRAARGEKIIF